jgi:hypothetical protein
VKYDEVIQVQFWFDLKELAAIKKDLEWLLASVPPFALDTFCFEFLVNLRELLKKYE